MATHNDGIHYWPVFGHDGTRGVMANRQPSDLVGDIVDEIRDLADGRHGRFRIGPTSSG